MSEELNKTIRIRTTVNDTVNSNGETKSNYVTLQLDQDYDTFEILSLKIQSTDAYKLHNSDYGVIVGRVQANGGFGVPNAKISVFIESDNENDSNEVVSIYSYSSTSDKDKNDYQYNLLPDEAVNDCHKAVGTFPNKTYMLDNDVLLEVFDKYYKYTARTNNSGDYIICGVPTGNHTLHMDLDISDCGILSQRPRDFVYKGYTIEQFENANQFKSGTDYQALSQISRQDQNVYVQPFWGNDSLGETIGITRADINVNFKFEPTCVFMGCVVSDAQSNGITKKCVPTENMGLMEELTTGEGKIEMIRKTPSGSIEEFQIKGNALIDGNGVWCYQIPMNLDYMRTDEYGNMVPTDDPNKGIPTRTSVRFRVSLNDFDGGAENYFRGKVLVPHNPQDDMTTDKVKHDDYDYNFGSKTRDESFRDLFWNNVYTVKSFIPRFQKSQNWKNKKFSGIKGCNHSGTNNPIPYNNIRIKLPFMFMVMCALIKGYIMIISVVNLLINIFWDLFSFLGNIDGLGNNLQGSMGTLAKGQAYKTINGDLCPDLENWYFAPMIGIGKRTYCKDRWVGYFDDSGNYHHEHTWENPATITNMCKQTLSEVSEYNEQPDNQSIDQSNVQSSEKARCLTRNTDYLIACIEMNLAQEYKVINFDFYNDWINGMVYIPRWVREQKLKTKRKKTENGRITYTEEKIKGCMDDSSIFGDTRRYFQSCNLGYSYNASTKTYTTLQTSNGCGEKSSKQNCHKTHNVIAYAFGSNGGVVHEETTSKQQKVYYCKPCEWKDGNRRKLILYATDIVLLGSLNDCSLYGIPQAFRLLSSSSYVMPTNLALTNMDDDGYLYASSSDGGTYCTTKSKEASSTDTSTLSNGTGVKKVDNNNYQEVAKYYSVVSGDSEATYVGYGKNDRNDFEQEINNYPYEDAIPTTEAAGISWNYSGPGQGSNSTDVRKSLYFPGGHFLGLSCVNTQTNVKSCVNLIRACEIGSNISQRREQQRVDETGLQYYNYFVPTGLISTEDISSVSFRSMFATMNMKPLIADKIDENTGYKVYSFIYMRPNGFDGVLNSKMENDSDFNTKVEVIDNYKYLLEVGAKESDSYDSNESKNTYRRTSESVNRDYYDFRLGLINVDNKDRKERLKKKYVFYKDNVVYFPQYENSYYFYFGLKDGATAFDKLMSDYFSTCGSEKLLSNPEATVYTQASLCDGNKATVSMDNVTLPVEYKAIQLDGSYTYPTGGTKTETANDYIISLSGLPNGYYRVDMTDSNGLSFSSKFNIGLDLINVGITKYDFKTEILEDKSTTGYTGLADKNGTAELAKYFCESYENGYTTLGGYLNIYNDIDLGTSQKEITDEDVCIVIARKISDYDKEHGVTNSDYVIIGSGDTSNVEKLLEEKTGIEYSYLSEYSFVLNEDYYTKAFLWKVLETYDVYVGYACKTGVIDTLAYYNSYTFNGYEMFDMILGSTGVRYKSKNPDELSLKDLSGHWWDDFDAEYSGTVTDWLIKKAIINQDEVPTKIDESGNTVADGNEIETFDVNVICYDKNGNLGNSVLAGTPENGSGTYNNPWMTDLSGNGITWYDNEQSSMYKGYSIEDDYSIFPSHDKKIKTDDIFDIYPKHVYAKMSVSSDGSVLSDSISVSSNVDVVIDNNITTLSGFTYMHGGLRPQVKNWRAILNDPLIVKFNEGTVITMYISNIHTIGYDVEKRRTIFDLVYNGLITLSDGNTLNDDNFQDYFESVHPLVMYPVISRPFTANMITKIDGFNNEEMVYPNEAYIINSLLEINNGITYKGCLGEVIINGREYNAGMDDDYYCLHTDINSGHTIMITAMPLKSRDESPYTSMPNNIDSQSFSVKDGIPEFNDESLSGWTKYMDDIESNSKLKQVTISASTESNGFFGNIYFAFLTGRNATYDLDGTIFGEDEYKLESSVIILRCDGSNYETMLNDDNTDKFLMINNLSESDKRAAINNIIRNAYCKNCVAFGDDGTNINDENIVYFLADINSFNKSSEIEKQYSYIKNFISGSTEHEETHIYGNYINETGAITFSSINNDFDYTEIKDIFMSEDGRYSILNYSDYESEYSYKEAIGILKSNINKKLESSSYSYNSHFVLNQEIGSELLGENGGINLDSRIIKGKNPFYTIKYGSSNIKCIIGLNKNLVDSGIICYRVYIPAPASIKEELKYPNSDDDNLYNLVPGLVFNYNDNSFVETAYTYAIKNERVYYIPANDYSNKLTTLDFEGTYNWEYGSKSYHDTYKIKMSPLGFMFTLRYK